MLQQKICMVGAYAVGKTSLTRRYVHSLFSEEYLTTIGVKVDRKEIEVGSRAVKLMIWDLVGEDDFTPLSLSQVRGAGGYLLVVDRTRPETLDIGVRIRERIDAELGPLAHVVLLNKSDLAGESELELSAKEVELAFPQACDLLETSAKTGTNVEDAFRRLTEVILHS